MVSKFQEDSMSKQRRRCERNEEKERNER
jgi:hypothetical protein